MLKRKEVFENYVDPALKEIVDRWNEEMKKILEEHLQEKGKFDLLLEGNTVCIIDNKMSMVERELFSNLDASKQKKLREFLHRELEGTLAEDGWIPEVTRNWVKLIVPDEEERMAQKPTLFERIFG